MADHAATEEALAASGLTYTVLRDGWYVENYTGQVATYLEHGMVGAAGEGKVSIAPRSDYAEAAAVGPHHRRARGQGLRARRRGR